MPTTPTDVLSKTRRVEIKTRRLVNDMMVGAYHSQFKGRGMDFEELREYIPGDDVRSIDWNVTARMRRPFVKNYREERELTTFLVVDVSASGDFGSQRLTKREFAAEVGATLAASALRNGDKVGLLLFSDQIELFVPARKGRRHLLRVIRELVAFPPKSRGTDIQHSLDFFNHVQRRRAIVFLITDFLHSIGGAEQRESRRDLFHEIGQTNMRHDLVCLHLHDPRETELPAAGLLVIEDAETGETVEIDTAREQTRRAFAATGQRRLEGIERVLSESAVDSLRLQVGDEFAPRLQHFFERRRRR
ncbi:MAG: DUF58 domain-containing protein [Chthoniobacteraceae bacterium]